MGIQGGGPGYSVDGEIEGRAEVALIGMMGLGGEELVLACALSLLLMVDELCLSDSR